MLAIQTEDVELENKYFVLEKDSIFLKFIKFVINNDKIDALQKQYLFEVFEYGDKNNLLSATVILGASAKMLLMQLCEVQHAYLVSTEK